MAFKSFAVMLCVIAFSLFGAGAALAVQDPCGSAFDGATPNNPISKTANKTSAQPGETVTYTVQWSSTGAAKADITDCFRVDDGSNPVLNAIVTVSNTAQDVTNVGPNGSLQTLNLNVTIPNNPLLIGHAVVDRIKTTHGTVESRSGLVSVSVVAPPPVNNAPTVGCPTTSISDLGVDFTATGSDIDGDALTYAWDFGDGATANTGATNTVHHDFASGGTYQVVVTVSDGSLSGSSGNCPVTVTAPVIPPVNNAPTVGCPTTSISDLGVDFTATGSDIDGDALTYAWDFGDGATTNTGALNTAHHDFASDGTYQVLVTVSDGSLSGSSSSCPVTVAAQVIQPANQAPSVSCPLAVVDFLDVSFTAIAADADGVITNYHWDFGDGSTADTALPAVQHTFASGGLQNITVTVTDDDGATASTSGGCTATTVAPATGGTTPPPAGDDDDTVVLAVKESRTLPKTGLSTTPLAWLAAVLLFSGLLLRSAKPRPARVVFAGRGLVAQQVAQYGLEMASSARPARMYAHRRM